MDFIAASFIRKASDVLAIREILEDNDVHHIQIISKIENQEGLDNIDEIIKMSDGIMIARRFGCRNSYRRNSVGTEGNN